jgi:HPt (histidine-containing phosphotransfer) domain-containing protein
MSYFFHSRHNQGAVMAYKNLASRLGMDEGDVEELVDLFITTTFSDINKIKKSVADGHAADVAAISHSIKGVAGNMGFDDIFVLSKEMERQARQRCLDQFDIYLSELEKKMNRL